MKDWLEGTVEIQKRAYKHDPALLRGPEHAEFIRWNVLAAQAELIEALDETNWKTWSNPVPDDESAVEHRTQFLTELVDACMFIANLAVSVGCTDEEWSDLYHAKWVKNAERQEREEGYVSRRGVDKCLRCGRALDDVAKSSIVVGICELCERKS